MRNILVTLKFCGTNYHGFQVQKNAFGVCEAFQNAVEKALGARYDIKGCSRTDAGVHANKYCLSMKINEDIPCDRLIPALNTRLPGDIAVTDAREVPEDFHARYSCKAKEYVYVIRNSRIKDPFSPNLAYRLSYNLDADMLDREAKAFVGTHDFAAFCARPGGDTVRTIFSSCVSRKGEYVYFTVCGNGFLYNMVRIMAGTLVHIAMEKLPQGSIPGIIASRDRSRAGKTMPPHGLFLNDVFYDLGGMLWVKP